MVGHISSTHDARLMGAGFDTWGGSAFVQARLALLGKTVFLLAGGFFVVMNGLLLCGGGLGILPALATQANLMHFLAASVMGALWAVSRGRPWSLQMLGWLDAGSLVLAGIGQYTLEEKIGSGGMGEVWRARHRMLIRPAAVKLISSPELGSSGARDPEQRLRRFEREARATAGLRSPHTVQLYDFGVTEEGTLYYVMELLDGMDLDTLVERYGAVPPERAIQLLTQVCASLEDAHENGLVHRDIKPANIVVCRVGSAWDFVKVLDFGLVKLGSPKQQQNLLLSAEDNVSGTPGFMAPEVLLGGSTDQRVDLYALGCVAYWLVTAQLVFKGPGAIQVMSDHVHSLPVPPSARAAQSLPPELERLILQCLEKDPAKRPASARELAARLQAIALEAPWTRERAERWWAEHAPERAARRSVADVLLSQEARPQHIIQPRVIQQARR